jgi:DnaJ-class molecular chaperone
MSDAHDRKRPAAARSRKPSSSSTGEDGEDDSAVEEAQKPRVCMPCHGTGKVISNLGEHARKVTCPWCRGSGERLTGEDAQEFQREQAASKRH